MVFFGPSGHVGILLTRSLTGERLETIDGEFGMNYGSSVESVLRQMNEPAAQDKQVKLNAEYPSADIFESKVNGRFDPFFNG
jgi:hypothetical protein